MTSEDPSENNIPNADDIHRSDFMTEKTVHPERLLTAFVYAYLDRQSRAQEFVGLSLYGLGIEVISKKPLMLDIQGRRFVGNRMVPECDASSSQIRAVSLLTFLAHVVGCATDTNYDKHFDRVLSEVIATFSQSHRYRGLSESARASLEYPDSMSGLEVLVEDGILLDYFCEKIRG